MKHKCSFAVLLNEIQNSFNMRFLLFGFFVLVNYTSFSQQGFIEGKVVDDSGEPLVGAVYELTNSNVKFIRQGVTDETGQFKINDLSVDNYRLRIQYTGYKKAEKEIELSALNMRINIGEVLLSATSEMLEEVVVETNKLLVRNEVDRKIYDISQMETVKGGDLTDVLDIIPSVEVDNVNSTVSLRGDENVKITIDNRPTRIPLEALFRQLRADMIKEIEVITNPSSKYDAEGVSGIINIVTGGEKLKGISGSVSTNYNSNGKVGGFGNINLNTKKWNYGANIGNFGWAGDFSGLNYRETDFGGNSFITDNNSKGEFDGGGIWTGLNIDHYLDSVNTIFFAFSYRDGGGDNVSQNNFLLKENVGAITSQSSQSSTSENNWPGMEANLSYQRDFSKKRNHNLLVDYKFDRRTGSHFLSYENISSIIKGQPNETSVKEEQSVDRDGNTHTVRADFTNPVSKTITFELGAKADISSTDNDTFRSRFNEVSNEFEPIISRNNRYRFKRNISAGYGTIQKKLGKWGFKTGIRAEYTSQKSELFTQTTTSDGQDYLSLFPSAYISRDLSEADQLVFSFARRISRPSSRQLNPFTTSVDTTSFWSGNPELNPEIANVFELSHTKIFKSSTINTAVYYRLVNNLIRRVTVVDDNNISNTTYTNYSSSNTKGAEINANIRPVRWFDLNLGSNLNIIEIKNSANVLKNPTSLQLSTNFRSNFNLSKKVSIQLSGRQKGPFETPQGNRTNTFRLNGGASVKLLKNKGRIGVNARNILNDNKWEHESFGDNFYALSSHQYTGRVLTVRFSYNFGKYKPSKRKAERKEEKVRGSGDDIDQGGGGGQQQ